MLKALNCCQRIRRRYRTEWVEDMPENIEKNTIYIIGGRKYPFWAAVTCPRKECKRVIHLEVSPDFEKRWRFREHRDGKLTLNPSIYVTKYPCKCHYWIRKGCVVWSEIPPFSVPKENRIS